MKKMIVIISVLVLSFLVSNCGASGPKADLAYKFVSKRGIGPGIERYIFAYSVNNGPLQNMDIYVYEDYNNFLISPEFIKSQAQTTYLYDTTELNRNFTSPFRMSKDTVKDLQEAIQKALLWYIEDFKLDAIEKDQEKKESSE